MYFYSIGEESESCLVTTTTQAASATLVIQPEINQSPLPEVYSQASIPNDLGTYSVLDLQCLDNGKKHWLLKNAYRPTIDFKFPVRQEYGKSRSFQYGWLREYTWLSYSRSKNGGYCTTCTLFAKNRSSLGQLMNVPMTHVQKKHYKSTAHKRPTN